MKNLLLSVFLFVTISPLLAQAKAEIFTEKDIQGKWKLVTYATDEVSLDITTGQATVNDVVAKTKGPELAEVLKEDTEAQLEKLKYDYLEITGTKFSLLTEGVVKLGTYKIKRDKKNNQVVTATFKDTSKSTVPLIMKDGKLVLHQKYTGKTLTFEKMP